MGVREKVNKTATVVAIPEWPTRGTGGPLGFSYLLLRCLAARLPRDLDLFVLATGCGQMVRIDSVESVDSLVSAGDAARKKAKWRTVSLMYSRLPYSRIRAVRNGFTKIRQYRRRQQSEQIRKLVEPLTVKYRKLVLHFHDIETGAKVVGAVRGLQNAILIFSEHGKGGLVREYTQMVEEDARDSTLSWLRSQYETVLSAAQTVVFPSEGALRLFAEVNGFLCDLYRSKLTVIRSGVPGHLDSTSQRDRHRPAIVFAIAQHVPEKGIDRMLRAMFSCRERGVEFQLRIAGAETVMSRSLYELRRELRLEDDVCFLGAISHEAILQELNACDLFLACPRVVVFDLSLLEAMAAARPIITSRLPGNVEALGEEYPGFFEYDEDIPSVIGKILNDPSFADRLGTSNKLRWQSEFTLSKMADRYLSVYTFPRS